MCHRPDVFIKEVLNKPKHFTARKNWTYHTRIPLSALLFASSLSLALPLPLSYKPSVSLPSALSIKRTTRAHLQNFFNPRQKNLLTFFFASSYFFFLLLLVKLSSPDFFLQSPSLCSLIHSLDNFPLSLAKKKTGST